MTPGTWFPPTRHRGHAPSWIGALFLTSLITLILKVHPSTAASGCSDGTREGLHRFESAAVCSGSWEGHIKNANSLCASGWRVCTSFDYEVLRNITWDHAIAVPGCMAINAAQDGGRCRQCRDDLEQDDLGGIGEACPHRITGQSSCISGGRIDASCCVDSHFHTACHFKPKVMTGVVCCRLPVKKPNIVVKPPERLRVYRDLIFLLTCQASGMPPPRVYWYKDGSRLPRGNPRITPLPSDGSGIIIKRVKELTSGDLLVTLTRKSDTGLYTCEAINEEGIDMASSYVSIIGSNSAEMGYHSQGRMYSLHLSGCADGSTDGLSDYKTIHACQGRWEGHVKYGKALCARGWRVCNPRNQHTLKTLSTSELQEMPGCYAYNAANRGNKCKRCKSNRMSGVGRDCGSSDSSQTSCLAQGRIDVFKPNETSTCEFTPGVTTGVLCCRKLRKRKIRRMCNPQCQNKGVCSYYNTCRCPEGYKGARCQIAICRPKCGSKGECVRPNKCKCKPGYTGPTCRKKNVRCKSACLNGGRCHRGQCRCKTRFWGKACQYTVQHVLLSRLNRTER